MSQHRAFNIALLGLLFFNITSKAQSGVQESPTIDNASSGARNTTSAAIQVNTTSDGLEILTDWALNATSRDPSCNIVPYPPDNELSIASCEDAISQVPDTTTALLDPFGQLLQVPMRYSSCE